MGNNNHNEELDALERVELERVEKELNTTLDAGAIDKVYSTPQSTDNVREIVSTGSKAHRDIYTKADVADMQLATVVALVIHRDEEHDNPQGVNKILDMLEMWTSVKAKRIELYSDTIIGERRNAGRGRGLGDWIREKAGMGGPE